MTSPGQQSFPLFGPNDIPAPSEGAVPLLYVASALSHLDSDGRQLVHLSCRQIAQAAADVTRDADSPWWLRVHLPIDWSPPWGDDGRTPAQVYNLNTSRVHEAAALVVFGYKGGSIGAGQEFGLACLRRLPILYLRRRDEPLSRQVEGTPANITIVTFERPDELAGAVAKFLRAHRVEIEDHARRVENQVVVFEALRALLNDAWMVRDERARLTAATEARLHIRRLERLATDSVALGAASMEEVFAAAGALGVDAVRALGAEPLPDLEPTELSALRTAAAEYEWDGPTTLDLLVSAQIERARGGVRRFRLLSVIDWVRFQRRHER
jgi:hypothetical protein